MKSKFWVAPCLALCVDFTCLADESLVEELVVTGTYLPSEYAKNLGKGYSITAEKIALLAPSTLLDVLQQVPGLLVTQWGGAAGLTKLSLRGGEANYTAILIDGVPVNDPTNSRGGGFDLGMINPQTVERIDVYYGGMSAVFGSDALSGVINIVTKQNADTGEIAGSLAIDGSDTIRTNARISGRVGENTSVSLSLSHSENDRSFFGQAYASSQIAFSVTSIINDKLNWEASGNYIEAEGEYFPEHSGGEQLAVIRQPEARDNNQRAVAATINYQANEWWETKTRFSHSKREEVIVSPGIATGVLSGVPASSSDAYYSASNISVNNVISAWDETYFAFGGAVRREHGEFFGELDFGFTVPFEFDLKRDTSSIFSEFTSSITPGTKFLASMRYDDSEAGQAFSPRIELLQRYGQSTFSARYSEGFKLPSFFALGHPLIGNQDLLPERGKSWEISFQRQLWDDKVDLKFTAFQNIFRDLVDFDPELFEMVNRDKVIAKGLDMSGTVQFTDSFGTSFSISYANYTSSQSQSLTGRPKWTGFIDAYYKAADDWQLYANLSFSGEHIDSSIPTGFMTLPMVSRLDMTFTKYVENWATVTLGVKNLLDNKDLVSIGTPQLGRYAYVGLRFQLAAS